MIWLIGQSIFDLGTLCPWCMIVWVVTIPLFLAVTFRNLARGRLRRRRRAASAAPLLPWVAPDHASSATLADLRCIAQLQLDLFIAEPRTTLA